MSDKLQNGIRSASDNGAGRVMAAGDWAADKVEGVKDAAMGLVDKVQERARNVTRTVTDTAENVVDKAGGWLGDKEQSVENVVSDGYHNAEHAIEHFGRDVTAIVKKYPLTVVAIGLGLGLLLGRASSTRA
ncbi:hypothetical protein BH11PLA2_BH11PLA2_10040 [soil metagenome]